MKIFKTSMLILWVFCGAVFLIGVLTPLDFTHKLIMHTSFFLFINGLSVLGFLLTDFITVKKNKLLLGLVASVLLITAIELSPRFGSGWKTQEILYREKENPENVIAFQTEDRGAFGVNKRNAKIIRITPLFTFTTTLPKNAVIGDEWSRVNELVLQTP